MKFKDFINEAGQIMFDSPQDFQVLYHGKMVNIQGATSVDPRFEFHNLKLPDNQAKKFLGQTDFSLPVTTPQGRGYIVSDRRSSFLSGRGQLSKQPVGRFEDIPQDWADHALILNHENEDLLNRKVTPGAQIANQPLGVPQRLIN